MVKGSIDSESTCRFRSVVMIGNRRWEWCSLYNAETSKLDCDMCDYRKLYREPMELRREIIS